MDVLLAGDNFSFQRWKREIHIQASHSRAFHNFNQLCPCMVTLKMPGYLQHFVGQLVKSSQVYPRNISQETLNAELGIACIRLHFLCKNFIAPMPRWCIQACNNIKHIFDDQIDHTIFEVEFAKVLLGAERIRGSIMDTTRGRCKRAAVT